MTSRSGKVNKIEIVVMSRTVHRLFISALVVIVFSTLIFLIYKGLSYYDLSLENRVYHTDHKLLKPSGVMGHGFGMIGSLFMIVGVGSYMIRKRYRFMARTGLVKHWLEFHIFLCTLGPILILFHTAFKFGGLVAISFWSMVAVFLSGIIGRFIYLQIPRSIEGRELTLNEVRDMKTDVARAVKEVYMLDEEGFNYLNDSIKRRDYKYRKNPFIRYIFRSAEDRKVIRSVKSFLRQKNIPAGESKKILILVKNDIRLSRKIEMLETMQSLFRYWHVVHLPFAFVMLIIMIIHVAVTIMFGYRWIF